MVLPMGLRFEEINPPKKEEKARRKNQPLKKQRLVK